MNHFIENKRKLKICQAKGKVSYLDRSLLICDPLPFLFEIVNSPKASDTARVQTCNALLDRGWGKATIFICNVENHVLRAWSET